MGAGFLGWLRLGEVSLRIGRGRLGWVGRVGLWVGSRRLV